MKKHSIDDDTSFHGGAADQWGGMKRWWDKQDPDTQSRYCCHGAYVGVAGAFAELKVPGCPLCVKHGYQPMTADSEWTPDEYFTNNY